MSRSSGERATPQPVRGHLFFHNLQNLWACCNPQCDHDTTQPEMRIASIPSHRPTVGALHSSHRLTCGCGARVLNLIVCEMCGDVFLGGYKAIVEMSGQRVTFLTADQPDLEGMPDTRRASVESMASTRSFGRFPTTLSAWLRPKIRIGNSRAQPIAGHGRGSTRPRAGCSMDRRGRCLLARTKYPGGCIRLAARRAPTNQPCPASARAAMQITAAAASSRRPFVTTAPDFRRPRRSWQAR